ncbi:MAG: endolytic transglycosylase MltG, partial [Deltaproteobacteria bacterium]|nr:endolytic transglycosylase MltG [Deltaproteobacteria bacterium]
VILASVVEKETAVAEERPLIAGVFLNRLRKRVRLQSDPTVIYGLRNFDGNLTRAHLQQDTPYNTYTRRGLPVGPICNPGAASIQAVLNPTSTSYLYFVAKKDGTHHFSTTLVEHNAAVVRHQKRR